MEMFMGNPEPTRKVLENADLTKREVDEIVPDGNSTRIPMGQSNFGGYPGGRIM